MTITSRARHWLGSWLERRSALGAGYVASAPVLSGTYVTPQTALALTAVYAAISVISKDVATLPKGIYRKLPDGGVRLDSTNELNELLGVETDDETSALKFDLDTQGHTLGWGNGYAEVVRNTRTGAPEQIHMLHPARTIPKYTKAGKLFYLLDNEKELLPENVLHFAGLGFDGIRGYTPLTVARQSLGLALAAEQFGAAFFGNGAIQKGILKTAKKLKEEAVQSLRRSFNQAHQGVQNAHQFMILEEGFDWINTSINPDDAQFLGTRQFQILEIARLFNLPPHKIGDYSQSHMTNIEQANLDYLTTTLNFWITMRERVFNRRLLSRDDRRKWVILHDMTALLRGDTATRGAFYQILRNLGAINTDEIRLKEGMPPIGAAKGGDKYLVQAQYQPLDQAGKPQDAGGKQRLIELHTLNGRSHDE